MVLKQSEKAWLMRKAIKLASAGLSVSRISADLKIARSTLSDWLGKAKKAEINFEMIKNLSDDEIDEIFFPAGRTTRDLYQPRWDEIHIAMGKHGTVLSDQYRRYLSSVPEGRTTMSKSLFHSEFRRMKGTFPDDVVAMHVANTFYPGRIAMIDYSGDPLVMRSGPLAGKKLQVFVGVLPFSSLTDLVESHPKLTGKNIQISLSSRVVFRATQPLALSGAVWDGG